MDAATSKQAASQIVNAPIFLKPYAAKEALVPGVFPHAGTTQAALNHIFGRVAAQGRRGSLELDELLSPLAFEVLSTAMRNRGGLYGDAMVPGVRMRNRFARVFAVLDEALSEAVGTAHASIRQKLCDDTHLFFRLVVPVLRQTLRNVRHQLWCMQKSEASLRHRIGEQKQHLYEALWLSARLVQQALAWGAVSYQRPGTEVRALLVSCLEQEQFALRSPALTCHPLRKAIESALVCAVHVMHLPVHHIRLAQVGEALACVAERFEQYPVASVLRYATGAQRAQAPATLSAGAHPHLVDVCKVLENLAQCVPADAQTAMVLQREGQKPRAVVGKFSYNHLQVLRVQLGVDNPSPQACGPGVLKAHAAFAPAELGELRHDGTNALRWLHLPVPQAVAQPGSMVLVEEAPGRYALGVVRYVWAEGGGACYLGVEVVFQNTVIASVRATSGQWPGHPFASRACVVCESEKFNGLVVFAPLDARSDVAATVEMPQALVVEPTDGHAYRMAAWVGRWPECVAVAYSKS